MSQSFFILVKNFRNILEFLEKYLKFGRYTRKCKGERKVLEATGQLVGNFSFSLSVSLEQITFKSRLNDLILSSCGKFFQTFSFLLTRKKEYVKVNE
ncbi:hypothetical protein K4I03_1455 [Streptococcus sanguinis]|nr:hypothetical protein [Streptococcus sanguinis]